jgi:hypothetical protein
MIHGARPSAAPSALKSLQKARFQSGRPDLNRGPHRPELWAKSRGVVGSICKSMGSGVGSPPLRTSDIAADSRGFGRGMDSLPNDPGASAGALVGALTSSRHANFQDLARRSEDVDAPADRVVTTLDPLPFTRWTLPRSLASSSSWAKGPAPSSPLLFGDMCPISRVVPRRVGGRTRVGLPFRTVSVHYRHA